jgi:PAS domain S-box-containing protein
MKEIVKNMASPAAAAEKPRMSRSRRMLVIDDEQIVCQLVEGFLSLDGWEVDTALALDQAEAMLQEKMYPVVLCDVHLPGSSTDFLKRFKERFPLAQVVMFTGDPTIATVREALQHGAYDYVPKPCRREELTRIVQRAFDTFLLLVEQERLQAENENYRRHLEELVDKRTAQLRESELRYRALFHRAVDAIFLVEIPSGVICDLNLAAARLAGESGANLLGHPIGELLGHQLDEALNEAQTTGHGEWRFEHVVFDGRGDEARIAQVAVGKVEFDSQTCLQVVARDVTEQIHLTERTSRMEQELQNEQRLAAVGLLASGIAHNINSPLMGIYGTAQLIKMKYPDLDDIDGVIAQVERINGIIRNLMWKSRQEQETRPQEINLNQLLQEELKFLEADLDFKHNVAKRYAFADRVPAIMGRYSDFSQAIMNVVRNALDAMHEREKRELSVSTDVRDDEIRVAVRDTGCGIAPEDQERIFLPFYTTKPVMGREKAHEPTGTGLGLTTVQKLLAPYGARFEIESALGAGTTFTICLPVAANSPRAAAPLPDEESATP